MQFRVDQRFEASPELVLAAYTDPDFYASLTGLTKVSAPEVLSRDQEGDAIRLRIRYAFIASLPPAATAVIDPKKLTWVEDSRYDLAARTSTSRLLPDHYPDRLTASAKAAIEAVADDPPRTARHITGDLNVRMPFVGGQVEKAIVSGLREHLVEEERAAATWFAARS